MQTESLYNIAYHRLSSFLEQHALKKTPERFTILRIITSQNRTFNVNLIDVELRKAKYFLSKSTIYNTLHLFEQAHLIKRIWIGSKTGYQLLLVDDNRGIYWQKEHQKIRLDREIEAELMEIIEKKTDKKIYRAILFTNEK